MRADTLARILGYSGLIPFAVFAFGVSALDDYPGALSQRGFLVYSLAILCFLAGTLWGSSAQLEPRTRALRLVISNGIVILAVLAYLVAQPVIVTLLLALAYLALLWYERRAVLDAPGYLLLRTRLTLAVVALHLLFLVGLLLR